MSDTTDTASAFTPSTALYFDARTWTHGDCRSFGGEDACSVTPPPTSVEGRHYQTADGNSLQL